MVGFKKIPKKAILLSVIVVLVLTVWATVNTNKIKLPSLAEMNVTPLQTTFEPLLKGEAWKPEKPADPEGFAPALENDRFLLSMQPESGRFKVTEKQSGYEWRSNPAAEALAAETVKGTFLSNLQSPFILEYYQDERTQRQVTNALEPKTIISIVLGGQTIQVNYHFTAIKIEFSIQYTLTDQGLKACIPAESIKETDKYHVVDIGLLPFLGAAQVSETDGYLFVPDGPGALIRFNPMRALIGEGYNYRVYGNDISNMRFDLLMPREWIRFPVFGIKRAGHALFGIITQGDFASSIHAMPAGMVSTFHSVFASFMYREEYNQRLSRNGAPVKVFQKELLKRDRTVEYRFLSGSDADYSGMARNYRSYLLETGQLVKRIKPVEHVPLNLIFKGGDSIEKYNRQQYVPVTTFNQAGQIVDDLVNNGVSNMMISYLNWQDGGNYDMLKKFPVERQLGGNRDAKSFVQHMHDYGFKVLFEDDYIVADKESFGLTARSDGMRSIDGTVRSDDGFWLQPHLTLGLGTKTIQTLKKIGIDGIFQNWLGEDLASDYNPDAPYKRDEVSHLYDWLLDYTRIELGMASVYDGRIDTLKSVDFIQGFGLDTSHDFIVDEAVPFYPMVLHGAVGYSSVPGNLRKNDYKDDMLKMIEYGAVPAFLITHDSSRKLKDVDVGFLFSSQYSLWKDRIIEEYRSFEQLTPLYGQQIIHHEKKSEGVYVSVYEDGTQVTVNYNTRSFDVKKGGGQVDKQ